MPHLNDEDSGTSDECWRALLERCRHRAELLMRLWLASVRKSQAQRDVLMTRWTFVMSMRDEARRAAEREGT